MPREKGSDVNLAADLVRLACMRSIEAAAIVTNDADSAGAIRVVRAHAGIPVGIVNPQSGKSSRELIAEASFERVIRRADIEASMLPESLRDGDRLLVRPTGW